MPYANTHNVLNLRAIADNLLAYIAANQAAAFTALGFSSLKLIKDFQDSVANRAVPVFPAIAFSDDNDAQDFSGDGLIRAGYSCTFEVMVQNADPNVAVADARKYARAIASLVRNIDDDSLLADTGANVATLQSLETGFDPIRANEMQNDFLLMFQVRATYTVSGPAYS